MNVILKSLLRCLVTSFSLSPLSDVLSCSLVWNIFLCLFIFSECLCFFLCIRKIHYVSWSRKSWFYEEGILWCPEAQCPCSPVPGSLLWWSCSYWSGCLLAFLTAVAALCQQMPFEIHAAAFLLGHCEWSILCLPGSLVMLGGWRMPGSCTGWRVWHGAGPPAKRKECLELAPTDTSAVGLKEGRESWESIPLPSRASLFLML